MILQIATSHMHFKCIFGLRGPLGLRVLTLGFHKNPFYKRKNCPKSYIEQKKTDLFSKQYMNAAEAIGYKWI